MNITDFDVIYDERVYKCVDCFTLFNEGHKTPECGIDKPDRIEILCINEDGNIIALRDEAWMFRFVRKERKQ